MYSQATWLSIQEVLIKPHWWRQQTSFCEKKKELSVSTYFQGEHLSDKLTENYLKKIFF